jgi:transcriptional regulator with XRE-family HTH domain
MTRRAPDDPDTGSASSASDARGASSASFGEFIRNQRRLSAMSLRQLADLTSVSNAYLSQLERGLHQPSLRIVRAIAGALDISPDAMLTQAGLLDAAAPEHNGHRPGHTDTEAAIAADEQLTVDDRTILLQLYRRLRRDPD